MIEEVETVPLRGRRAYWDGTNLDEIRELAGDRLVGVFDTTVQIRLSDGKVHIVEQGWTVTVLQDVPEEDELVVSSVNATRTVFRVREPVNA